MARRATHFATLILACGCSLEPGHKRSGERVYECYTEEPASHFMVQFREKTVTLMDNGRRAELNFVPSIWPQSSDRYEGGGYALTLDPEAQLTDPKGHVRGPCQD